MDADCTERWAAHRREHDLEERAVAQRSQYVDARLDAVNKALLLLEQQQPRYLWRVDYERAHEDLRKRMDLGEQSRANMEGRFWALGISLSLLTVGVNLLLHWLVPH